VFTFLRGIILRFLKKCSRCTEL